LIIFYTDNDNINTMSDVRIEVKHHPDGGNIDLYKHNHKLHSAYAVYYKEGNTCFLQYLWSYKRHQGYGTLVLAATYKAMQKNGCKNVHTLVRPTDGLYPFDKYVRFLSQIGLRKTLFNKNVMFAKIPNDIGDRFVKECNLNDIKTKNHPVGYLM
jgi:hypothetical protein